MNGPELRHSQVLTPTYQQFVSVKLLHGIANRTEVFVSNVLEETDDCLTWSAIGGFLSFKTKERERRNSWFCSLLFDTIIRYVFISERVIASGHFLLSVHRPAHIGARC